MKEDYGTMVEALQELKKNGFTHNFRVKGDVIECSTDDTILKPGQCKVEEAYRFEGESNPSDMSIVYGITSRDGKHKGILVSAYGTYSEPLTDELMHLLKMDHH